MPILISGTAAINITPIIPSVPTAFFITFVQLKTDSTVSPNIFPTTGTNVDTAVFVVLVANWSTPFPKLLSIVSKHVKIVKNMHNNHIDVDFIYFDNLFNWTSSEMLEIMPNTVAIITTGIKIWFIKTVIMFVEINIIDWIPVDDVMLPSWNA